MSKSSTSNQLQTSKNKKRRLSMNGKEIVMNNWLKLGWNINDPHFYIGYNI